MTNDERFELMWNHYHMQVDENRAVSRQLDELRDNRALLQKTAEYALKCQERADKMAFILGTAWAFIRGNVETFKQHGLQRNAAFDEGLAFFEKGIMELFYSDKV